MECQGMLKNPTQGEFDLMNVTTLTVFSDYV